MKTSSHVQDFRPSEGIAEKNRISRGDVGDGDVGVHLRFIATLGNGDIGGQGAFAELAEVNSDDAMLDDAGVFRDRLGGGELVAMPLAVVDGHGVQRRVAVRFRDREAGCAIQPAGEKDDGGAGSVVMRGIVGQERYDWWIFDFGYGWVEY